MSEQERLFFVCLILIVASFFLFGCRTYPPPPKYVGYSLEER